MSAVLSLAGVTAGYGSARVLNDISLSVHESEMVCIIGPNGSGKSTALKVIAGALGHVGGTVTIRGREAASGRVDDSPRAAIGYVPQVNNIFPSLTTRENLRIMAPRSWRRAEVDSRTGQLCERFEVLHEVRDRPASLLSGGERQILALSMALVRRPDILLLDEPSAALSPMATRDIFATIAELRQENISILLVEQNARLAMRISDRCYVLENGSVALEGEAVRLLQDKRLESLYLGGDLETDSDADQREAGPARDRPEEDEV